MLTDRELDETLRSASENVASLLQRSLSSFPRRRVWNLEFQEREDIEFYTSLEEHVYATSHFAAISHVAVQSIQKYPTYLFI